MKIYIYKLHILSLVLLFSLLIAPNTWGQSSTDSLSSALLRRPVVNADGSNNKNEPPITSFTVYLNGTANRILTEDATRFQNNDDNIPGSGIFGVQLGNFPDLQTGDSVRVRFSDRRLQQQGNLTAYIDTLPWSDNNPFGSLQLEQKDLPAAPVDVQVQQGPEEGVQVSWTGAPDMRYAVYRKTTVDTINSGKEVFYYQQVADSVASDSIVDKEGRTDDFYIVYAINSSGIWSPHSEIPTPWTNLKASVPEPVIPSWPVLKDMYYKAWEIGLNQTKHGTKANGFVDWYVDEAFDNRIFQWDLCFSMAWAKYSQGGMPNIESLNNFYMNQHPDGAISGVINESDGSDDQPKDSPYFTRNNLFSWAEWEYYQTTGDSSRFDKVVPILADYGRWVEQNRRHPNGHYYWSGFGSGMDNSPRSNATTFYPPYSWVDYDANEALAAWYLARMAEVAGHETVEKEFEALQDTLKYLVNRDMWSAEDQYYWDLDRDGSFMKVKTVASFWPMWGRITEEKHLEGLIGHLKDPKEYKRPHRVPTLAADQPEYSPQGNYWRGSVWAPTNHMVIEGLMANDRDSLARAIVVNHLKNVARVFEDTGTLWENYAPESAAPGSDSRPDFVGWSGVGPIAQLIENYIGIVPHVPANEMEWNLLAEREVGLKNLEFGDFTIKEIRAVPQDLANDSYTITVNSEGAFKLNLNTSTTDTTLNIPEGQSTHTVTSTALKPGNATLQPDRVQLHGNYPNPYNNSTTITYSLPRRMQVKLKVFNMAGRLMGTPLRDQKSAGRHTIRINSAGWSSGVYFYRLLTPEGNFTRKMILIK